MDDASAATARRRKQYYSVGDAIWGCRLIGGSAKLVALRLGKNWPRIFPAIATLCDDTGLSERTVRDALRELERKQVIQTTRRPGTSSLYAFVGVSIPELGADDGDGGGRQNPPPSLPRQEPPPPPAELAPPLRQISPPNSRNGTLEPKGGRSARAATRGPRPLQLVFHTSLEGWELSDELRAEALALGITPKALDRRLKRLRLVRIGGRGGVTDRDAYVRGCIEEWAEWEAERAGNAQRGAGNGVSSSDRGGGGTWVPTAKMRAFAAKHGLDIDSLAGEYVRSGEPAKRGNGADADDAFVKRMCKLVRERAQRSAAA